MSIEHHPTDSMLAAFAAGTLDHGQHIAIATHLVILSAMPHLHAFNGASRRCGADKPSAGCDVERRAGGS